MKILIVIHDYCKVVQLAVYSEWEYNCFKYQNTSE